MVKRQKLQQYAIQLLAECFATCVHILIGEAALANYKFTQQTSHSTLPIAIAFGVGVYSGNVDRKSREIRIASPLVISKTLKKCLFVKALQCLIGSILFPNLSLL